MTEHLALEKLGAETGTAHRDEGPRVSVAPAVNPPGQHALARAALALDQHHGVGGGNPPGLLEDRGELSVGAVEHDLGHLGPDLLLQVGHPVVQELDPPNPLEGRANLGWRERLGQEIERSSAHRLHRAIDAAMSRDDHHRQAGPVAEHLLHQVKPGFRPQTQVDEHRIARAPARAA